MLVDANILIYAASRDSPFHQPAKEWLESALNGPRRIAIPWLSLWAFVRITTNPRASSHPLDPPSAWEFVDAWRRAPSTWTPDPGNGHSDIMRGLLSRYRLGGPTTTDVVLAALCIEYGLDIVSNDTDFARFREINWINPLDPR